jgi:hypothetical protein
VALSVSITSEPQPRALRNAAVLLGMGILISGAALRLPRPVDFTAEIKSFGTVEKKVLSVYNAALTQTRTRKLSDEQLAETLQKDMLPEWQGAYHNWMR